MAVDFSELVCENYAFEANLEATSTFIGHGDISRVLTAADDNMELLGLVRVMERAYGYRAARF